MPYCNARRCDFYAIFSCLFLLFSEFIFMNVPVLLKCIYLFRCKLQIISHKFLSGKIICVELVGFDIYNSYVKENELI